MKLVLGTIQDQSLIPLIEGIHLRGGRIAGSFAAHVASPNIGFNPSDIDIWVEDEQKSMKVVDFIKMHYYYTVSVKGPRQNPYFEDISNIIDVTVSGNPGKKFQVIENNKPIHEVVSDFDYSICKAFLDPSRIPGVWVDENFLQDVENKRLRIDKVGDKRTYGAIFYRLTKYMDRGFRPKFEDIVQLIASVKEEDKLILILYIIGMDSLSEKIRDKLKLLYSFAQIDSKIEFQLGL